MDSNTLLDDTQHDEDIAKNGDMNFTRHSPSVEPVSSEDQIRTEAEFVVPSVPLPFEHDDQSAPAQSPIYGPDGTRSSNIDDLTAEDVPDF